MKKWFIFIWLLLPLYGYAAQEIVLLYPSGKEIKTDLAAIGRLEFSPDSVFLVSLDGMRLGAEAKGKLQHIRVAQKSVSNIDAVPETELFVYPNPTTNTLTINGIEHNTTARIYTTNGQLLQAVSLFEGSNTLSVESLGVGTYLLQINTHVIRFIKQ